MFEQTLLLLLLLPRKPQSGRSSLSVPAAAVALKLLPVWQIFNMAGATRESEVLSCFCFWCLVAFLCAY